MFLRAYTRLVHLIWKGREETMPVGRTYHTPIPLGGAVPHLVSALNLYARDHREGRFANEVMNALLHEIMHQIHRSSNLSGGELWIQRYRLLS